jgi:hypothetical protein
MNKTPQTDPLRTRVLELTEQLTEHSHLLRDYALTPGNAWLAKSELAQVGQVMSDLESLLEEIKQADSELA